MSHQQPYVTTITIELVTPGPFEDNFPENWTLKDVHKQLAYGPGRGKIEFTKSEPLDSPRPGILAYPIDGDYILPPVYCAVCSMPFTVAEWDIRHTGTLPTDEVHEHCCPTCPKENA